MKELTEILNKISHFDEDEKAILATVVDVVGSGYRRPGARMLIDQNGYGIGTVSGGCLEADVLVRAKKVLETNEPAVITYDTTKDENSVFGLGMGCRGIVRILLEEIDKESAFLQYVSGRFVDREVCRIATVIEPAKPDLKVGSRILLDSPLHNAGSFSPQEILETRELFDGNSLVRRATYGEVFLETIRPPLRLLLFGAGYDALPLVKFAKDLGWHVTVIDHRPAFANSDRLPEADEIAVSAVDELDADAFFDKNSVAVIMTHSYERDSKILPRLLESELLYVGALGPKTRTEKILLESGKVWSQNLHAPIGLDIGGDTPESIALAIVSEIQAVLKDRQGGFLRDRKGSIYKRS